MHHYDTIIKAREEFRQLVRLGDAIPLDRAALLIAREAYPELDEQQVLGKLDELGLHLRLRLRQQPLPEAKLATLKNYFFGEYGITGNSDNYYDPDNSYLNRVLERRTGIPISLAVILLEVSRRAGVRAVGIGMPGHFLVKLTFGDVETIIDPFHHGVELTAFDCKALFDTIFQGQLDFHIDMLNEVSNLQIVQRLLTNLKGIYLNRKDHAMALAMVEKLILVSPNNPGEVRDWSLLAYQLGMLQRAWEGLDHYLSVVDDDPNQEILERIRTRMWRHLVN